MSKKKHTVSNVELTEEDKKGEVTSLELKEYKRIKEIILVNHLPATAKQEFVLGFNSTIIVRVLPKGETHDT